MCYFIGETRRQYMLLLHMRSILVSSVQNQEAVGPIISMRYTAEERETIGGAGSAAATVRRRERIVIVATRACFSVKRENVKRPLWVEGKQGDSPCKAAAVDAHIVLQRLEHGNLELVDALQREPSHLWCSGTQ